MSTKLLIGTSGYSYKDWVGPVYPVGTADKDFLRLYADRFNLTELNFSYYRQPDARTIERMLHITGDDFVFAIKGHRSITHEVGADLDEQIRIFKQGVQPLRDAVRLGALVMQFPFSFHYSTDSRKYLDRICKVFDGYPLAVEFRNNQWQRDSVYQGLEKRGVAFVNVDEPLLPGLMRPTSVAVPSHAYVRFHGRNAANWWQGDSASRYDYRYTDDELMEWVPRIRDMAAKSNKVMVLFNNHWEGQAADNAKRLKELMEQYGIAKKK